ncbi:MAG: hypothetical protein R3A12_18510 [Ignavibacteria bacterium]
MIRLINPSLLLTTIQSSIYSGRVYCAYDELIKSGEEVKGIFFSYSSNNGISWDSSRRITIIDTNYKIGDVV